MIEEGRTLLFPIIVFLVLIILHALATASKVAFATLDKDKLRQDRENGDMKAFFILRMTEDSSSLLVALDFIQKLIIMTMGATVVHQLTHFIMQLCQKFNLDIVQGFILFLSIILTTMVLFIFGSLFPKGIASQDKEESARNLINITRFLKTIIKPFTFISEKFAKGILRIMGINEIKTGTNISPEDVRGMLELAHEKAFFTDLEKGMIDSILGLNSKDCEDIMTARTEVFVIDVNDDPQDYVSEMIELRYSRIPVYEDEIDNIIGLIYMKDYLLEAYRYGFEKVDIRKILKPAYFVPESKNITDLFVELQRERKHMAILIDEYGGFSGIVTIEDLIEEITGDIDDEYDQDIPDIRIVDNKTFYAMGSLSIKELNANARTHFNEDSEDYDTLGGLLIHQLGYIPNDGEKKSLEIDGISFYIDRIWDKRIQRVRIHLPENEPVFNEGE